MPFVIFAWISLIAYTFVNIIEKLTSRFLIKNPWLFNFVENGFALAFISIVALSRGLGPVGDWKNLISAAIFWTLGNIFFFLALTKVDISILSPAYNIKTAFVLIIGYFLLGETLTSHQLFLVLAILFAGFLLFYDEKFKFNEFLSRSSVILLLEMISFAICTYFVNQALKTTDFWTMTFWYQLITVVLLLLTVPLFKSEIRSIKPRQISTVAICSALATLGLITSNKAYESNIGISSVIITIPLSMLLAFGFSFFAPELLEKHTLKTYLIRFGSAAIMVVSAIFLSI